MTFPSIRPFQGRGYSNRFKKTLQRLYKFPHTIGTSPSMISGQKRPNEISYPLGCLLDFHINPTTASQGLEYRMTPHPYTISSFNLKSLSTFNLNLQSQRYGDTKSPTDLWVIPNYPTYIVHNLKYQSQVALSTHKSQLSISTIRWYQITHGFTGNTLLPNLYRSTIHYHNQSLIINVRNS